MIRRGRGETDDERKSSSQSKEGKATVRVSPYSSEDTAAEVAQSPERERRRVHRWSVAKGHIRAGLVDSGPTASFIHPVCVYFKEGIRRVKKDNRFTCVSGKTVKLFWG